MTSRTRFNLIKKIYEDPSQPAGFGGLQKVWHRARRTDPGVSLDDVKRVLSSLSSYTLHKRRRLKFATRPHLSPGINHYFQMDLMVLNENLAKLNRHRYILFVIDIFSKKLYLRPLKTKKGEEVSRALQSIIRANNNIPPSKVSSDMGTEFSNSQVRALFKRYNILHFTSQNLYHSAVVERVIRTLKEKIGRYMTHHQTKVFIPRLPDFVKAYNDSPHRALPPGITPNSVNTDNEFSVWKYQYASILRRAPGYSNKPRFEVGQQVKLSSFPNTFRKSLDATHTRENFIVTQVLDTSPTTYIVTDLSGEPIKGAFYREELQAISTPQR